MSYSSKDTFKVLDYLIENPKVNPMLEMSVNSNLCAPQSKFEEFVDKVKYITDRVTKETGTTFTPKNYKIYWKSVE